MIEEKDNEQFNTENLPENEKQERGAMPNGEKEPVPYSLPQVEFAPEDLNKTQSETEEATEQASNSAESENVAESVENQETTENKSETILPEAITKIADSLVERLDPVLAPVEEVIKENVIEPILDGVSALTEQISEITTSEKSDDIADAPQPISSAEMLSKVNFADSAETSVFVTSQPYDVLEADEETASQKLGKATAEESEEEEELDVLGIEKLPVLPETNRARLQVQSPNRIFLYWNVAGNPFATLQKAFGNRAGNYSLVLRLINVANNDEKLFRAGKEGSWWFDVSSNANYRVDIGFLAANRPFIKLLSSNSVETPRSAPSPRVDTESDWRVSRLQFARVLDVSGYAHDALPVVFGFGEDNVTDEAATIAVLNQLTSAAPASADGFDVEEMRGLLSALAAGVPLEALRDAMSPSLTEWLASVLQQEPDAFSAENVLAALQAVFGSDFADEIAEMSEEQRRQILQPVFGASAIHFPEIEFSRLRFPNLKFPKRFFPTSPVFVNRES